MTDETMDVTIKDVPVETVRAWVGFAMGGAADLLAEAARAALAEWEAQQKPRYEVELDCFLGCWYLLDRSTDTKFFTHGPEAEAEARALADRLNGEVNP